jgi:uncharacterized protein YbjT (DUF2867 family)
MTILVAGATGTVGSHIVTQLAEAGHDVRALSRSKAEPPYVQGDLADAATLPLDGVTALHLITFSGDTPLTNGAEIVARARRAGVRRITVLSGWEESSVEQALRESDIGWTLLQPVEFMSNAVEWAESVRTERVVRSFANWPSSVVHEADIAAVAVTALVEEGHAGRTHMITGPEALTAQQRAAEIGRALGEEVRFEKLTEEQERARLEPYGPDYVEFGIALGANPPDTAALVLPTVEQVTGRPARTFAQWADEHAASFR